MGCKEHVSEDYWYEKMGTCQRNTLCHIQKEPRRKVEAAQITWIISKSDAIPESGMQKN